MAVLPILTWPDPRLARAAKAVGAPDAAIRKLADDMLETMYAAPGRGLAGPQVGAMRRIFVMDCAGPDADPAPLVALDPEISWAADETDVAEEGCLSIPGIAVAVSRPVSVVMRWTGLDGRAHERRLDGIAARCAQHEIDHLDGTVTFDRLDAAARAAAEAAYAAAREDPDTGAAP